jgi:adenylate cyclase
MNTPGGMLARIAARLQLTVAPVQRWLSDGDIAHILSDFREAERRGLMLASFVRAAIILALMIFFALTWDVTSAGFAFLVFSPLGLALIGLVQYILLRTRMSPHWAKYAFVAADCIYLTLLLGLRHQFSNDLPTATITIKEGGVLFFFAFLVHGAFTYSPRFVLWTGFCITMGWLALLWMALNEPGTTFDLTSASLGGATDMWERYGSPHYLPAMKITYDFAVLFFLALGLAAAVARSRRLVLDASQAERSRANLARHFSPRMVDWATHLDRASFAPVRQECAILFADIRGFTSLCEAQTPEQSVNLLRRFHARMQDRLFAMNGTLDRIMGDGFLATFGVPMQGGPDQANASSAAACAVEMLAAVGDLNAQLLSEGQKPIQIGIGLHFGPVMFGDIGSARMATFTVVGDTVNLASRLQGLTRSFGSPVAMSAAFVDRLRKEGGADAFRSRLRSEGLHGVRGRLGEIEVFTLGGENWTAGG